MKKLILDLDDTLCSSKDLRNRREQAILDFLGEKTEAYQLLRKTNSTINSLKLLGVSRQEFYKIIERVPLFIKKDEKLIQLIKTLKDRYKLVVLSNNSRLLVCETLKQLGIQEEISESYSGEDFQNPKPSPEVFRIVQSGDICVGNNFKKDLEIPKQKGALTILISEKNNTDADYTIPSIYDLEKFI